MAANTGFIDGGDILVYVETSTGVFTPVAHCTECSIKHSTEVRTRKTKDTGQSSLKRAGEQSTTINVSALALYDSFNFFDFRALQLAGAAIKLKYSGRPAADVTSGAALVAEQAGDKYEEGMFLMTALERNDAKDADSTMSATFENSGLPEVKTVSA